MRTSDKLKSALCDAGGVVCINGSEKDREIIQEAIKEVENMEELLNKNCGDCFYCEIYGVELISKKLGKAIKCNKFNFKTWEKEKACACFREK